MNKPIMHPASMGQARCELVIEAAPDRTWQALVEKTHQWWPNDFYSRTDATFRIEPELGGRMFEDQGEGNGLIWGNVIGVEPPRALDVQCFLTADFGGPALSFLSIRLEAFDSGTLFSFSDTIFGFPGANTVANQQDGWSNLFSELKRYLETAS